MVDAAYRTNAAAGAELAEAPTARQRHPFRVVSPSEQHGSEGEVPEVALSSGWGDLIDQIRNTAVRLREKEARLGEREEQVRQLVLRTKEELQGAAERVFRAEVQIQDMEAQCKREVADWERRTREAEEKVRSLESWLTRMHDAIASELD